MKNNMEKIDKAIEILQAFKEGKTILKEVETNEPLLGGQYGITNINDLLKWLIEQPYNLSIKKQPTYRPYANAKEFIKASKEHRAYVNNGAYNTTICEFYDTSLMLYNKETAITFEELFEDYKWSDDNTPCGILEG